MYMQSEYRFKKYSPHRHRALGMMGLLCVLAAVLCVLAVQRRQENPDEGDSAPEEIELPNYITEDLLTVNAYSRPGTKLEEVNAVVIHYVGNPGTTAAQNRTYFQSLAQTGQTYASSNFIVGLSGETILCVPLDEVAYCSNTRNDDTISVEYCHPDESGAPTDVTYSALVRLTAWLCDAYDLDPQTDVLRHYDVIGKECPKYYVVDEDAWTQFKTDVEKAMK